MDLSQDPHHTCATQNDLLLRFLSSLPLLRNNSKSSITVTARILTILVFACLSAVITNEPNRTQLIERPAQTAFFGLTISALVTGSIYAIIQSLRGGNFAKSGIAINAALTEDYAAILGFQIGVDNWKHLLHSPLAWIAAAIVIRVNTLEFVVRNISCKIPALESLLPFFMVIWDGICRARSRGGPALSADHNFRLFLPATISLFDIIATGVDVFPESTAVCPSYLRTPVLVIFAQFSGVLLDMWILYALRKAFITIRHQRSGVDDRGILLLTILYLLSASLFLITGIISSIIPFYRVFIQYVDRDYLVSVAWTSILFVPTAICASRMLAYDKSFDLIVTLWTVLSIGKLFSGIHNLDSSLIPASYLPKIHPVLIILPTICALLGLLSTSPRVRSPVRPRPRDLMFISILPLSGLLLLALEGRYENTSHLVHPIAQLQRLADMQHTHWASQADQSRSLEEAVEEYVRRYGRHPPPGFDEWYNFAVDRKSIIIDDFDTIEENLSPFWKVKPDHLRSRLALLLSDTENGCVEVSVRSGNVTIGKIVPTHRWMIEGVVRMMGPFAKALPDMDIAFNINDEPRVAVPYSQLENLRRIPTVIEASNVLSNEWSTNRAKRISESDVKRLRKNQPLDMTDYSFRKNWRAFGSASCPASSPAKRSQIWDSSKLCTWCYTPHNIGAFPNNWAYAADPCHQPDLASLHGFYISAAALKVTRELIPIFSQSRAGGYLDILYPSAWNYIDKVKYEPSTEFPDPAWVEKENTLFWRGGTTEGRAHNGAWRNFARQRLVNAANNSTIKTPILFPSATGFAYVPMRVQAFVASFFIKTANYSNDIAFVGEETRCDNGDCQAQERHFGFASEVDFQYHWKHRFLLDTDGAGFSGRFLSFLQSRCLPIKTGIFREWYDARLVAWKHFVPVDIRLHGLWSTMAYFATGGFGGSGDANNSPGEDIAEAGREWASKVLRKEDMEVYLYRLLLEYGRLIDDRRNELGFSGRS